MKKAVILIVILGLIGGAIYLVSVFMNDKEEGNSYSAAEVVSGSADIQIKKSADKNLAIAKAQELYRKAVYEGQDLSNGPCLSNEVVPGWVADIAHNPRQKIDDLPGNQCEAYSKGTAKHFVELDPDGQLIRAQ